jgi:rRNA-processing protein FCF1
MSPEMKPASKKPVVVIDANALMMPFQFSINIDIELRRLLGSFEMVVPSSVIVELKRVALEQKASDAKGALKLAARYRTHRVEGRGDDAVLASAVGLGAILLTNDAGLRRRAREAGLRTACLRGRSHLELV